MAPPPQSTAAAAAAAPIDLQPPSIEGVVHSDETESVVPQVQVLATEINRSPEKDEPSGKIEAAVSSAQGSAAELASEVKQSPAKSERSEFMDRLDPGGEVTLMCFATPLYAVLAAWPLWRVADQPQALLWTFAHLTCLYLSLWIITLSTTASVSGVFFRITYVLMLAFTAVHLIGPMNGMMFLYTGMTYVAGMLGYAVAEHLQRAGFEQTANALCSAPFINSKDRRRREEVVSVMHAVTVVMSAPVLVRMAWVLLAPYSGQNLDVLMVELTAEIFAAAVLWILYVTEFILRGALVSMETFACTAFIGWIASSSLAFLLNIYIAQAAGMLVMWLGWMAMGGFFGYSLAVRAFYCKMLLTRIDSSPAAKEQNGGTC